MSNYLTIAQFEDEYNHMLDLGISPFFSWWADRTEASVNIKIDSFFNGTSYHDVFRLPYERMILANQGLKIINDYYLFKALTKVSFLYTQGGSKLQRATKTLDTRHRHILELEILKMENG